MVWFHGGGFQGGSTHDIVPNLMVQPPSSPLIFVSFEYRLGQFGFLGGSEIKGNGALNAGLLDQLLGEGGNSGRLFHAVMGDSPSLSFLPSYDDDYVEAIFNQFAAFAGCNSNVMKCLRASDGNKLALAGSQTIAARPATLYTFAPILDGSFLQERPVEAFKGGHFAKVPVLFGSNTDEGANWSASLPDASANTSMPNATQTTVYNFLRGQFSSLTRGSFDQAVTDFYPLSDYGTFSLQGQQMYGEMRYICTAGLITGAAFDHGLKAYQFQYVTH
ncbi:hypothetical protein C0991_010641 [Blastosporella zonata]|nr:hypothetical protein C0991_010641 [Blastosporella zonata]